MILSGRPVAMYAVHFWTTASDCEWNLDTLFNVFYWGLTSEVKDKFTARELSEDLDRLINQFDLWFRELLQDRTAKTMWYHHPTNATKLPPLLNKSCQSPCRLIITDSPKLRGSDDMLAAYACMAGPHRPFLSTVHWLVADGGPSPRLNPCFRTTRTQSYCLCWLWGGHIIPWLGANPTGPYWALLPETPQVCALNSHLRIKLSDNRLAI